MSKPCKGCGFYKGMSGSMSGGKCCHYMLITGELRNSPPEECNKFKPAGKGKKKQTYRFK